MYKLIYTSFSFILLTVLVAGCSHTADRRLALADTLMWTNPDSSLAILEAINRDSLQGEENLAYYALLLSQAQFRCNIPLTSDTLISKAVDYYSDNHNREHYTRALLYKGGAYEDMGKPVEAIKWYKQAEDNADSTDYRNLAQLNMRMGMLYYNNFADHDIDIDKFKKSLKYYKILEDNEKILLSHGYIGKIFRLTNQDSAKFHLDIAISLAKEIRDSADLFDCITSKSLSCFMAGDFQQAKYFAVYSINNGAGYINDHSYYNAARAYCALNEIDSAWFFLRKAETNPDNKQLLSMRYLTLSEFYESSNDHNNQKKYNNLFNELTDSLSNNSPVHKLLNIEDIQQENSKAIILKENNSLSNVLLCLAIVIIVLLFCFCVVLLKIGRDKKAYRDTLKIINEKSIIEKENLNLILSQLENKTKVLTKELLIKKSNYQVLADMVSQHIVIMDRLANIYETGSEINFKKEFKKIAADYNENDNFWKAAETHVNNNYNGLLEKIINICPKISQKQIKIVILYCMGFDYVNCAVILGTNARTMGVLCSRLADRLGTELSLRKFIDELKAKCLSVD